MPNHIPTSNAGQGSRVRAADEHADAPPAQRRRTGADRVPGPSGQLGGLAPRLPGPTLPLTRARAELWQFVRRPAHELLIDNMAFVDRTGIRDDARLLAPVDASRPAGVSALNGLHIPFALPIPDAPQVRLPANEGAEVAAARRQVVDWLGEMRQDAAELHAEGASPDGEADAFRKLDMLVMPAIVAALNAERPGLNLVYAHCIATGDRQATDHMGFGSANWDAFAQDIRPGRWRILMDNDAHGIALDMAVTCVPGQARPRASVIVLNPLLSPETIRAGVVAEIADQLRLPADWSLLVAEVPAQKDLRSCKIFALSMALKCAGGTFDELHRARLRGEALPLDLRDIDAALARPDETDSEADTNSTEYGDGGSDGESADLHRRARPPWPEVQPPGPIVLGQELLQSAQIVGPQFMKHAQSGSDVRTYIAARGPDAMQPVNKPQQNLIERHDAHRVVRWPAPAPPGFASTNHGTPLIYSASIELKRISFLDKAIRHAAACDANEVLALAAAMHTVNTRWKDRFA